MPNCLTISQSEINGLGLFAADNLTKGQEFGITHIKDERFQNGYIRTPLGGFFNHSESPNVEAYVDGDFIRLRALRDISKGEELTAFYWLYDIKGN